METLKKNVTLVIGISIPLLMILFVAGSIYIPRLFIKPHFNFLYISGDDSYYYSGHRYEVQNESLIKRELKKLGQPDYEGARPEPKLYLYDVARGESKPISFEEAERLRISPHTKSPDNFEIVYGNRNQGIFPFFWSSTDYNTRYLKGHGISKKLNLQLDGPPYYNYNNFRFIGWIQ